MASAARDESDSSSISHGDALGKPARQRVSVVRRGVDDLSHAVVLEPVWVVRWAVEGPHHHGHPGVAELVAQRVDVGRDQAEVLHDHGKRPEGTLRRMEDGCARPRLPMPFACGRGGRGHGPVRGEATEVVDPEDVDEGERPAESLDPPAEPLPLQGLPSRRAGCPTSDPCRSAGPAARRPRSRPGGRSSGGRPGRSSPRRRRSGRPRSDECRALPRRRGATTTHVGSAPGRRARRRRRSRPSRRSRTRLPARSGVARRRRPPRPGSASRPGQPANAEAEEYGEPYPSGGLSGRTCQNAAPAAESQSTKAYASGPSRPPGSEVGWRLTPTLRVSHMLRTVYLVRDGAATNPDSGRPPTRRRWPVSGQGVPRRHRLRPRRRSSATATVRSEEPCAFAAWGLDAGRKSHSSPWGTTASPLRSSPMCSGPWEFRFQAWADPYATWLDEFDRKVAGGQSDLSGELSEGVALFGDGTVDDMAGSCSGARCGGPTRRREELQLLHRRRA